MYKLLAAVLGVCVDWVAAKVQLHSAQSRPQLHRTAGVSIQHKSQILFQTEATSTVPETDESGAATLEPTTWACSPARRACPTGWG